MVLAGLLPRRPPPVVGGAAGLGVAALDPGVIAPWFPRIRALRTGPQVADHVAYGITVAWWLRRGRR